MKKFFFVALAAVFLVVAGIVIYVKFFTVTNAKFTTPLDVVAPAEIPGWKVKDIPLAESQGMLAHVLKTLDFDDYASREYTKGALSITFYAAYWKPGKRSPIDAGGHNPDACWVNFGWTRTAREYSVAGKKFSGRELVPYEFGVYERDGGTIPVFFWHLVNGEPHAYKDHRAGWKDGWAGVLFRLPKRIEDLRRLGLNQRREQLFVRISFPGQKIEDVLANPDFHDFMNKIDATGIFIDKPWGAESAPVIK